VFFCIGSKEYTDGGVSKTSDFQVEKVQKKEKLDRKIYKLFPLFLSIVLCV
jgi:hypothetical protein